MKEKWRENDEDNMMIYAAYNNFKFKKDSCAIFRTR